MRPLNIPVLLGTSRQGRMSAHAARFIVDLLNRRAGVTSALVGVSQLPLPTADDAGEAIKDAMFSATKAAADALVIVAPEYNHSFPGLLKHALDSCLNETSTSPSASPACHPDHLPASRRSEPTACDGGARAGHHFLGYQLRHNRQGVRRVRPAAG
jgi:hypothetical protein